MTTTPTTPTAPVSLPCLVCGTTLDDAFPDQDRNQPSGGTMFRSSGNYGSTVFDPFNDWETLEVNVCDTCMVAAARRGHVLHVTTTPSAPTITVTPWQREATVDVPEPHGTMTVPLRR